jgi:hypothetical protein
MVDARGRAGFPHETFAGVSVRGRAEHPFDRDLLLGDEMRGAKDSTHTAAAELLRDAIFPCHNVARLGQHRPRHRNRCRLAQQHIERRVGVGRTRARGQRLVLGAGGMRKTDRLRRGRGRIFTCVAGAPRNHARDGCAMPRPRRHVPVTRLNMRTVNRAGSASWRRRWRCSRARARSGCPPSCRIQRVPSPGAAAPETARR